jgi:aminoglycoside/choline kinase family phosphotransferase
MSGRLPSDASGLTPAWLSRALARDFPGVEVSGVRVIGRSASTNLHLRLGLEFAKRAGAPERVFAKLPPQEASHRQSIGAAAMGRREVNFYESVAPSLSLRVPVCYFSRIDADGSFLLLLEDVGASRFRISDGTWAVPEALAPRALEELAAMHVAYEHPDRLAEQAAWAAPTPLTDRAPILKKLHEVVTQHADQLSPSYVRVAELYLADPDSIDALWARGPQTFLHGDPHIGNLFLDRDRVGFLDWGMAVIGPALKDASYFLTMGVDAEDRHTAQRELLKHYLAARGRLGGAPISFDDAFSAHRVIAGYNVLASFLGLTPPYNAASRHVFSSNFRRRAIRSLDDLDTVAALRALVR